MAAGTAATGGGAAATVEEPTISMALPKGHMMENVFKLMEDAGLKVTLGHSRGYRPTIPLPNFDVKLLKPQNILGMLHNGSRDLGFAGKDWVEELGVDVVELLDTNLDPVKLVAASPDEHVLTNGGLHGRRLIVASEYENITRRWIAEKCPDATFFRAYGATESLPPEDADLIVDNAATGSTLRANNLKIIDTITSSTTRLFASKAAMADPAKKVIIERLVLNLRSVLDARKRRMVTFNVEKDLLPRVIEEVPRMRAPTISTLFGDAGYAVQIAVDASTLPSLLPHLKEIGVTDIVVSDIHQILA